MSKDLSEFTNYLISLSPLSSQTPDSLLAVEELKKRVKTVKISNLPKEMERLEIKMKET
jgi:hypothetical protein